MKGINAFLSQNFLVFPFIQQPPSSSHFCPSRLHWHDPTQQTLPYNTRVFPPSWTFPQIKKEKTWIREFSLAIMQALTNGKGWNWIEKESLRQQQARMNAYLAFSHHHHYLLPALAPPTLLIASFLPLILHTASLLLFVTLSSQSSKERGKQFIIWNIWPSLSFSKWAPSFQYIIYRLALSIP